MEKIIPTHDPQTGEINPYYEELTGKPNPLSMVVNKKITKIEQILKLYREQYIGQKFSYKSKYGGFLDGLICDGVHYTIEGNEHGSKFNIYVISEKNNVYEIENVYFKNEIF